MFKIASGKAEQNRSPSSRMNPARHTSLTPRPRSSAMSASSYCARDANPPWGSTRVSIPAARATPLVTVLDGHPHTLSFLATVNRVPHAALGVAQFGQSGAIEDLYRYNGIDTDSIIRAALDLVP
jgi:pyruvate dehydrogenase complex dehydrogenase (E1) component